MLFYRITLPDTKATCVIGNGRWYLSLFDIKKKKKKIGGNLVSNVAKPYKPKLVYCWGSGNLKINALKVGMNSLMTD